MFILPEHPAAAKKEEQSDEKLSVKSAEKLLDAAPKNFKDAVAAVKLPPWDANKPIAKTVDTPKKANPFLEPKTHKETKEDHLRTLAAHLSSEKAALKQHAAEKQAKKEALPGSAFAAGDEEDEAKKAAEAKLEAKAKQEAAIAAFYKKQAEKVQEKAEKAAAAEAKVEKKATDDAKKRKWARTLAGEKKKLAEKKAEKKAEKAAEKKTTAEEKKPAGHFPAAPKVQQHEDEKKGDFHLRSLSSHLKWVKSVQKQEDAEKVEQASKHKEDVAKAKEVAEEKRKLAAEAADAVAKAKAEHAAAEAAAKEAAAAARAKEEKAAAEKKAAAERKAAAEKKAAAEVPENPVPVAPVETPKHVDRYLRTQGEKKAEAEAAPAAVETPSHVDRAAATAAVVAAHALKTHGDDDKASLIAKVREAREAATPTILQRHVHPSTKAEKAEKTEKARGRAAETAAAVEAHGLKTHPKALRGAGKTPQMGLVYLWSAPLTSWGREIDSAPARHSVALLDTAADARVSHVAGRNGISAHQDAKFTEEMVAAQANKNLHISDGFGELEANDRKKEEEMNKEFKVYDPVAAVPTNDLKPRLRKSVELHDIFAKLEVQDAQVSDQLARLGDNADFGAVRRVEDESMRYLEEAQKPSAEITPAPLSWKDTEPEASISLHEPFLKMEKKDSAEVKETEHRQEMQLLQIH